MNSLPMAAEANAIIAKYDIKPWELLQGNVYMPALVKCSNLNKNPTQVAVPISVRL